MTYNQIIQLFQSIATAHLQIKTFGNGEEWEVNGELKPGILFPILYAIPIDVNETENSRLFRFNMLCFGQVKKDKSNENEVLSDCQSILSDIVKIFKNESEDYNLINDPIMFPFKESYGDFCAGWRTEVVIETDLNNNYCDVPNNSIVPPPPFILAVDSDVIDELSGLTYAFLSGPSNESEEFKIVTGGLSPDPGNLTVTPSENIEVYDGTTWQSSPFTIAYTGNLETALIYKVRLKSGLSVNDYTESVIITGGGADPFMISVSASVTPVLTVVATGGTITRDGDFLVHEITGDDIFEVINIGPVYNYVEYEGYAGGGGGASNGAGGAGGRVHGTNHTVVIGSYPVSIGAGGIGATVSTGTQGGNSSFDGIIAIGGGYGGAFNEPVGGNGGSGGSNSAGIYIPGLGTPGQGNNGGLSNYASGSGAGGGGVDAIAIDNNNDNPGTPGGAGHGSSITGSLVFRGGGGGGAGVTTGGVGGIGGGGHGGGASGSATSGQVNTGGGGGGSHSNGIVGGNGGSGVFYIKYYSPL